MRVVIQRVTEAKVTVSERETGKIGPGLLVLAGFEESDSSDDAEWMSKKISQLRIFNDNEGQMNLSVTEIGGNVLVVSQFTLHALTKKGNRPSFIKSARPEKAIPLYEYFVNELQKALNKKVETGVFGAKMEVSLINDGPVTITIDSKSKE